MIKTFMNMIALVLLFLLCGCSPGTYEEELADILGEDSRYYREIRRQGYLIRINYLPLRYFTLRELIAGQRKAGQKTAQLSGDAEAAITQEVEGRYGSGLYFIVTIGYEENKKDIMNEHIGNFGRWSENMQKLVYGMGDYIYLETEKAKEIRLSVYDFQRTFGYTKDRKMLLCFPKSFNDQPILSPDSEYLKVHFKEFGFGIGKQSVAWHVEDLME